MTRRLLALVALLSMSSESSTPFRLSLSVSPFTELVLSRGITFTDGKLTASNVEELQRLFAAHGATEVYARINTSRTKVRGFGDHTLQKGLERARLARKLGLPFNPELGLWRDYGDVRCQPPPDFADYPEIKTPEAPWSSLTIDQMLPALRSYGAVVAREILATGVKVNVWDIGNEVEFGMAGVTPPPLPNACDDTNGAGWYKPPDAIDPEIGKTPLASLLQQPEADRIAFLKKHVWPHEARMFAAVVNGIRSVAPRARISTHVSGVAAELPATGVAFYEAMREGGFRPDELGFSFYPTSSNRPPQRLETFRTTTAAVRKALGRPVFVAEFGYPAAQMTEGAFKNWNYAVENYPQTPAGQASFYADFVKWARGAGVTGIRPWAPDLPAPGWEPFAFFKLEKNTATGRPVLDAFADTLAKRK
jgi:arabinogalactan endo-1,4-beta-galactosidase